MQTGTSRPAARSLRTTLTPSRSGIVTSRTMTEGGRSATAASAARPPAAVDTAKPSSRNARSRACRTDGSSSTTRTCGSGVAMPPMMGQRAEHVLHLGDGQVEPLRERCRELVVLRLAQLVERVLHCGLRDAELAGEVRREVAVVALPPRRPELVAELAERGAHLRGVDAELARQCSGPGPRTAVPRA